MFFIEHLACYITTYFQHGKRKKNMSNYYACIYWKSKSLLLLVILQKSYQT